MDLGALELLERFHRYVALERRLSPNTSSAYRSELAALVAFCDREGVPCWDALTPALVRRYAAKSHARGMSAASIARRLSSVRSFMRYLVGRERAIRANPVADVRGPKLPRRLPAVLDVDQMARLLSIEGDDPLTVRDRAIMELLYSSALRLIELVRLDCCDLDLADRTVRVFGKGSVVRIVPVGSYAATALRVWLRVRGKLARDGEHALFVGRNRRRVGGRSIQQRIAEHARRQRIPMHVHPHMFRHSAATHFLEGCGDIRAVQDFLGHVSISTTAIYTHLNFASIAKAYDAAHPRAHRTERSDDGPDLRTHGGGDRRALPSSSPDRAALEARRAAHAADGRDDSLGRPGPP
jgi:integrase/recombinase XerC